MGGVTRDLSPAIVLAPDATARFATATFTTQVGQLAAGEHMITALYSQDDANFAGGTTALAVALTVGQTITKSGGAPIDPVNLNLNNPGTIPLAYTGGQCNVLTTGSAPVANTICSVSPASITVGSSPSKITVNVGTSSGSSTASLRHQHPWNATWLALPAVAFFALPVAGAFGNRSRRRRALLWLGLAVVVLILLSLPGCGGGFSNPSGLQPSTGATGSTLPGSYVVSVTYHDAQGNSVVVATIPLQVTY